MLIPLLLASAVAPLGDEPLDRVDLTDRPVRKFDLELPAEPWRRVSGSLPVAHAGGAGFLATVDGVGLQVDTDGDGKTDRRVEGAVDPTTKQRNAWVRLSSTRESGEPFTYAVRLMDAGAGWMWAPSSVVQGMAGKTKVRIVDLSGNGRFNDYGADAMILGSSKVACFLSQVIHVDGELYEVAVAADGSEIELAPYEGEVGSLDAQTSFDTEGKLISAVVQSADGMLCFDLANHRGAVEVPVGDYAIHSGQLGLGDARLFVQPGIASSIEVAEDAEVVFDWGGPVRAEFAYQRNGGQIAFSPNEVWYYGNAGEQYVGWDPIGKSPEFQVKDRLTGEVLVDAVFPGSC